MLYKYLNSLSPPYFKDHFVRCESHLRGLRNSKIDLALAVPMFRIIKGQKSFTYCGASTWNSIDSDTKMAPSINAFRSKLKENKHL